VLSIPSLLKEITRRISLLSSQNQLHAKIQDACWVNENTNNFIIRTCSEGYGSYLIFGGLTAFGQAFSHAIARYACEEALHSIMSRVSFFNCNIF